MTYISKDHDRVDQICAQVYGQQAGIVEAIFECNPHLAAYGECLPAGVVIDLPPLSSLALPDAASRHPTVQLWD